MLILLNQKEKNLNLEDLIFDKEEIELPNQMRRLKRVAENEPLLHKFITAPDGGATIVNSILQVDRSIAEDVLGTAAMAREIRDKIKEKYPGVPVVSYVNTSADVKAETDVCCTSANAVKVVESLNVDKVIFLPDQYLADYVAKNTKVKIISWKGTCIVHEQFTGKEIEDIKNQNPGIKVIAHPECPPDVIEASDFAGSTSGMVKYVKENQPKKVMLVTECSMSDNVEADNPNVSFIKPCNLCPYMKKINLEKILDCLENDTNEIILDNKTIEAARKSVIRMTEIGR